MQAGQHCNCVQVLVGRGCCPRNATHFLVGIGGIDPYQIFLLNRKSARPTSTRFRRNQEFHEFHSVTFFVCDTDVRDDVTCAGGCRCSGGGDADEGKGLREQEKQALFGREGLRLRRVSAGKLQSLVSSNRFWLAVLKQHLSKGSASKEKTRSQSQQWPRF